MTVKNLHCNVVKSIIAQFRVCRLWKPTELKKKKRHFLLPLNWLIILDDCEVPLRAVQQWDWYILTLTMVTASQNLVSAKFQRKLNQILMSFNNHWLGFAVQWWGWGSIMTKVFKQINGHWIFLSKVYVVSTLKFSVNKFECRVCLKPFNSCIWLKAI